MYFICPDIYEKRLDLLEKAVQRNLRHDPFIHPLGSPVSTSPPTITLIHFSTHSAGLEAEIAYSAPVYDQPLVQKGVQDGAASIPCVESKALEAAISKHLSIRRISARRSNSSSLSVALEFQATDVDGVFIGAALLDAARESLPGNDAALLQIVLHRHCLLVQRRMIDGRVRRSLSIALEFQAADIDGVFIGATLLDATGECFWHRSWGACRYCLLVSET